MASLIRGTTYPEGVNNNKNTKYNIFRTYIYLKLYFLKGKYAIFSKFKEFKDLVEKRTRKKLKVLRIDNGGEFYVKEFDQLCKQCGIA